MSAAIQSEGNYDRHHPAWDGACKPASKEHHHHRHNHHQISRLYGDSSSLSDASNVGFHGGRCSKKKKRKLRYLINKIITWQRITAILMFLAALAGVAAIVFRAPKSLFLRPVTVDFNLGTPQTLLLASVMWILVIAALISMITRAYLGFSEAGKHYARMILDHRNSGYSHHMARHVNRYRWILMGAFSTCIIISIALLAGVTDFFILTGIAIANVTLQWTAYVLERKNYKVPDEQSVTLLPMAFGVLLWAFIQGSIFAYFVLGLLSGALGVVAPYWPYYFSIIGVGLVQTCMGLLAFMRYTRASTCYTRNIYIEGCYLMAEVCYAVLAILPLFLGVFLQ